MSVHTKTAGDRTEARVLAALLDRYQTVCLPWGENQRFDLVFIDDEGCWQRVQCKTGRLRAGVVVFNTSSFTYHHPANRGTKHYSHGYSGDADLFGVWCPETREVYLVPVEAVGSTGCRLRIEPAKNGQQAGIRWAADFRIDGPEITPG